MREFNAALPIIIYNNLIFFFFFAKAWGKTIEKHSQIEIIKFGY